jgi:hypothetical protein
MKSQRRHELQHNTLDTELARGLTWMRNHGTKLAMGALAAALVVLIGTYFYRGHQQSVQEQTYQMSAWLYGSELPGLDAQRKAQLAQEEGFEGTLAKLLLGREAMEESFQELAKNPPNRIAAREKRDEALGHFQAVLAEANDRPLLASQARYSMVVVYEDRGETAKALEQCKAILDRPDLNDGYFIYRWARQKQKQLTRATGASREDRMVVVPPLRLKVRREAQAVLGALAGASSQRMTRLLAQDNTVKDKLEELSEALENSAGIFDLHVTTDEAMAISEDVSLSEDKTVLVMELVRSEEDWLLKSARIQPQEEAREALETYRNQNP